MAIKYFVLILIAGLSVVAFAADATIYEVDDVRVAPMLQTQWDQRGDGWGNNCFNYYTPGHSYCGCVATAVAQVMRYHRWPQDAVTSKTYSCKVQDNYGVESTQSLTMNGGTYNWNLMPLNPYTTGYSDAERESIGRLVFDVGVALRTTFGTAYGSAANAAAAMHALPDNFHYANAQAIWFNQSQNFAFTPERFQQLVVPSLDAGLPVVLSVNGTDGGHAIVADGYGFKDGKFYVHCNYGSSGWGDGWYAPPEFSGMGYPFTVCIGVVFNISPTNTGSIASGRVLDDGEPVAGATVTVKLAGGKFAEATTNEKGIYYFFGPAGTYDVSVNARGKYAARTIVLERIISSTTNSDGSYIIPYAFVCGGNSAWNDLQLGVSDLDPESDFSIDATDAFGSTGCRWRTSADFPWTVQSTNAVSGSALQSGYIYNGAPAGIETWLATDIKGPATISFRYIYYPYYNDTFSVFLDETNVLLTVCNTYGSFSDWQDPGEIQIPEGVHSLRFSYRTCFPNALTRFQGVCLDSLEYTYTGEIYSTTPVPVPSAWFKKYYPEYLSMLTTVENLDLFAGSDMDEDGLADWQEFALNTNPTNADALAITAITLHDGVVSLSFYPETCNPDYPRVVEGKTDLDNTWGAADFSHHRFFRMKVVLPQIDAP